MKVKREAVFRYDEKIISAITLENTVKQTFYARVPVIPLIFPVWLYGLSQCRLPVILWKEVEDNHMKSTRLHGKLYR